MQRWLQARSTCSLEVLLGQMGSKVLDALPPWGPWEVFVPWRSAPPSTAVLCGGWLSVGKAKGEEVLKPTVTGRGCIAVGEFGPSWHAGEIIETLDTIWGSLFTRAVTGRVLVASSRNELWKI